MSVAPELAAAVRACARRMSEASLMAVFGLTRAGLARVLAGERRSPDPPPPPAPSPEAPARRAIGAAPAVDLDAVRAFLAAIGRGVSALPGERFVTREGSVLGRAGLVAFANGERARRGLPEFGAGDDARA